jgi:hypothetical protein
MIIPTTNLDVNGFVLNSSNERYTFQVTSAMQAIYYAVKMVSGVPTVETVSLTGEYELVEVTANDDNLAETGGELVQVTTDLHSYGLQIDGFTITGTIELE